MAKQLEEIHNYRQEDGETLYQAWDRYNDLLYKCPTHDLNNQQKVSIFYKVIGVATRQMLDSQRLIPGMTPTLALEAIQNMATHSQKWHEGGSHRSLGGSLDGIVAITNKLENLGRDMLKLKESVHAIQVGCEICGGGHLTKNFPLIDEDIKIEEFKYGEANRPFQGSNGNGNGYWGGPPAYYNRGPFGEIRSNLEDTINKYLEDSTKRQKEQEEWLKNFQESTNKNLFSHDESLKHLETMIGKLSDEVQKRNGAQESKPSIACKAIFSEKDKSDDSSSIVQENEAGSFDRSQLRRNFPSELRRNLNTWPDEFLEFDESGSKVLDNWPGNPNMVPKSPSKKKYHLCKAIPVDNDKWYDLWASCNPHNDICDGGDDKERVKNNKYMWSSTNDEERKISFSIEDVEEPPSKHYCNPVMIVQGEST